MNRTPVESSNLKSVGYDESSQTLEIEFKSKKIYQYFNVPKKEYDNLLDAESVGKYFNQNIREFYKFKRIEEE